jgi:L-threonylcarbamoyladenylate synthase
MPTSIWPIDAHTPASERLAEAGHLLRSGGVVAFPTETVYGLGAAALDASAVQRIFVAKGRPAHNPLIVHALDTTAACTLVTEWPATAAALAERFWPGPLTLVLPRRAEVPDLVTGGGPTVAVRVSAHPVARGLIAALGGPIAAPSANRSGQLSPTTAQHVWASLGTAVDLILDGGPTPAGLESTVLDLTTDPPTLLRPGPISPEALTAVLGPLTIGAVVEAGVLRSPGLLEKHYAPHTPMILVHADAWAEFALPERAGVLTFGTPLGLPTEVNLPADPSAAGSRLYAALHDLDAAAHAVLVVRLPPDESAWLAINDRLQRAAARRVG